MGLAVVFASIAAGGTVASTLVGVYGVFGAGLIRVAGTLLLNAGITALAGRQTGSQQDTRQRIAQATELPFKRHVRGHCFATGTPMPGVAKGGFLYIAYLLNSRESAGNFELYLDNRVINSTGDPYDFDGAGATATNAPFLGHLNYWISLGDQTEPPAEFLANVPYDATTQPLGYKATDGAQGLTIIWLKVKRGSDGTFQDRWTSYPNVGVSVLGDWSKVWDYRDAAQDPLDTATHVFSSNPALHGVDLLMRNPFRPLPVSAIELPQWVAKADVDETPFPLKSGGTEPTYEIAGTTLFDGTEINDLMDPIMLASASQIVRSSGKVGVAAGAAKDICFTVTDMETLPTIATILPPEQQYDEVHVTYSPINRDGALAALRPYKVPNVIPDPLSSGLPRVLSVDLAFCASDTQAQRIRNITGKRSIYMRELKGGVLWPEAFNAIAGSWVEFDTEFTAMNGTFEVLSSSPMASPAGDDEGMAYRIPVGVRATGADIYAFDPATDEEDVVVRPFIYDEQRTQPTGPISVETGQEFDQDTGGTIILRAKASFAQSESANVSGYEYQFREQGEPYALSQLVDAETIEGEGDVEILFPISSNRLHDFRVRAISATGRSDWVEIAGVQYAFELSGVTGQAGLGQCTFDGIAPDSQFFEGVRVYRAAEGQSFAEAVSLGGVVPLEPGATFTVAVGEAGTNMLANPQFDTSSDWSGSDFDLSSGKAVHTPHNSTLSFLSQSLVFDAGIYRVGYTVADITAGSVLVRLVDSGSATLAQSDIATVAGVQTDTLTPSSEVGEFKFRVSGSFDGSIDNAVIYSPGPNALAQGAGSFFVVPVSTTGFEGTPTASIDLTII